YVEPVIPPVDDSFDWTQEKPRPYRPFKTGPFHMTMAIKKLPIDDWLLVEDTYKDVTRCKEETVRDHSDMTTGSSPEAADAIRELYSKILRYMMQRYPKLFYLNPDDPTKFYNSIKDTSIPLDPSSFGQDYKALISTLTSHIEEDFLVLIYDEDHQEYVLRGGSFTFPSGFDPSKKMNQTLRNIHNPVPLYKEKLETSMDKYFSRVKVGDWVQRFNWSVQTHFHRFAPEGNHGLNSDGLVKLNPHELDYSKVLLRVERQSLFRLPESKALVFTIRTYLTPVSQIRDEPRALDLIDAIENLPDSLKLYKKSLEWGPSVQGYL
ncbi:hypothetical protein NADFUDRAFT_12266, partial [Nadsonia fulvescens var. elongata DSM 6958]